MQSMHLEMSQVRTTHSNCDHSLTMAGQGQPSCIRWALSSFLLWNNGPRLLFHVNASAGCGAGAPYMCWCVNELIAKCMTNTINQHAHQRRTASE